jgi:hypothetical protein
MVYAIGILLFVGIAAGLTSWMVWRTWPPELRHAPIVLIVILISACALTESFRLLREFLKKD